MNDSNCADDKKHLQAAKPTKNSIAITFRTRYPFSTKFLNKIYGISQELYSTTTSIKTNNCAASFIPYYTYDLLLLVDTTSIMKKNQFKTESPLSPLEDLRKFYDSQLPTPKVGRIARPQIFEVNEEMVLKEYPRLSNYLYNNDTEELNYNNEPGFMEGNSLMWQLLVPTSALMHKHIADNQSNRYEYIWFIEDDIDTVGALSLLETIQKWDVSMLFLQQHPVSTHQIDLAAISLLGSGKVQKGSSKHLHTKSFHSILDRMKEVVDRKRQRERNNDSKSSYPLFDQKTPWTSFSDSVHRYSFRFAMLLYEQISSNTFAWCETFVHPIAWNDNYTVVDLRNLPSSTTMEEVLEEDNLLGVFRINQHSNRKEVLQYLNHTHTTQEKDAMKKFKELTVLFHGPSLDRAH